MLTRDEKSKLKRTIIAVTLRGCFLHFH